MNLLLPKLDWNVVAQVFNPDGSNSRREGCNYYRCYRVLNFPMNVHSEGLQLSNSQHCCVWRCKADWFRDDVWHCRLQNDRSGLVEWPKRFTLNKSMNIWDIKRVVSEDIILRDCAIIIRRGGGWKTRGGALHKIAAKIGGAQSKITHLTEGGP